MKIVIAPDSFKGSLSAVKVTNAIEKMLYKINPSFQIVSIPMADGGEGTIEAIIRAKDGEMIDCTVTGPDGKRIKAFYGIVGQTAVIEIAAAAGLYLLNKEARNPMHTTTFGVGELITDALNRGIRDFIIGLGGSATNDCGIGMMQALGASILNDYGQQVPFGGIGLGQVATICLEQLDKRLANCTFTIASDVTNPLIGENGATYIYGAQKGANDQQLVQLENSMKRYATIMKRDLRKDVANISGAGAAGGLGAAFIAFFNAPLRSGFDIIAEMTNLQSHLRHAGVVFTGEGRLDKQSVYGKVPFKVGQMANKFGVKVIVIAGDVEGDIDRLAPHFYRIFSLMSEAPSKTYAMKHTALLIEQLADKVVLELKQ